MSEMSHGCPAHRLVRGCWKLKQQVAAITVLLEKPTLLATALRLLFLGSGQQTTWTMPFFLFVPWLLNKEGRNKDLPLKGGYVWLGHT